jgi:hypothetical protein
MASDSQSDSFQSLSASGPWRNESCTGVPKTTVREILTLSFKQSYFIFYHDALREVVGIDSWRNTIKALFAPSLSEAHLSLLVNYSKSEGLKPAGEKVPVRYFPVTFMIFLIWEHQGGLKRLAHGGDVHNTWSAQSLSCYLSTHSIVFASLHGSLSLWF